MSAACSIDYYFSPPQKRLMSPENSTRKVNTILKCQEINDIVLSSFGPVEEGDKCLALFTLFLPICDIFPLSLSFSLSPCPFRFSFSISLFYFFIFCSSPPPLLSLPRSPPLTMVPPDAKDLSPSLRVNAAAICGDTTQEMGCAVHCVRLSADE